MSSRLATVDLPDGNGPGAFELRRHRRQRLLDAMADGGLDALVLSRSDNIAYASGARQLWMAGTRPVGPACVVIRATGRVHLVSVSAEGVPDEIGHDDLIPRAWSPGVLQRALAAVPGLHDAARVGTDSSKPGFERRLQGAAPGAEIVDANPVIWAARTTKSSGEVAHIRAATAVAASGLEAVEDALRPGITERELLGVFLERIARLGAPVPPTEGVVCVTPRRGPVALRRLAGDRRAGRGELVVVDAGAMVAGYEGGLGRTIVTATPADGAHEELAGRCRRALDTVVAACRPGATGGDVRRAWDATGEARPPVLLAHGIGLGMEPPLIGAPGGDDEVTLAQGVVLSVTSWVAVEGVGGWLERDVVLVGESPTVLEPLPSRAEVA